MFSIVKDSISVRRQIIPIFCTRWRPYTTALRLNWRTSILSGGKKVIFPQLLLKANRNELVSVPETLKRWRPLLLSPHKPPFLSAVAFASRLHWVLDFSTASPTVSRLRPGFVVWLILWKVIPPLSVRLSEVGQTSVLAEVPRLWKTFDVPNAVDT